MTKPNTLAESIMEGLQDALGYVKALADYLDSTYLPSEEEERGSAKDAFNAGWNAALGSIYTTEVINDAVKGARDKQDIQTIKDRANEPRTKVDVGDL